jgi:hypothetical protein
MQLRIAEELNSIKLSRTSSCARWLGGERPGVWKTICGIVTMMRTEIVLQTAVRSPPNDLAHLLAQHRFTELNLALL